MQLIRKILKENLSKLESTKDIIISMTETQELFVNDAQGNHIKITDIIVAENEEALAQLVPVPGKFYFVKSPVTLKYYVDAVTGFVPVTKVLDDALSSLKNQLETLSNSVDSLNTNLSGEITDLETALNTAIEQIEASIDAVNNTITSINETVKEHTNSIESIENTLTSYGNAITSLNEKYESIDLAITGINNAISSIGETLTELDNEITALDQKIDTINLAVGNNTTAVQEHSQAIKDINAEIDGINTALTIKKYKAVYDVEKLKAVKVEPEIFVPAYIFNPTERLYITDITLRSRTKPTQNITFEMKFIPELEDGSPGEEITLEEITLAADTYIATRNLNVQFADNEGYRKGFICVYVKDPGANHIEATFIVDLCIRNPIITEENQIT